MAQVGALVDGTAPAAVVGMLLALARVAAARGSATTAALPELVRAEVDVDTAMRREPAPPAAAASAAVPSPPTITTQVAPAEPYCPVANDDVDERLAVLLREHAALAGRFVRMAAGTYWLQRRAAPALRVHLRVLYGQVWVRVGGGWEDLVVYVGRHP
jgi:hypothetical protein